MEDGNAKTKRSIRPHPKPAMQPVNSLNQAIRQELWFVDTMVASPFRAARRQVQSQGGAFGQGADEALWAMEGMARLPIKLLQSAFGENLGHQGRAGSDTKLSKDPEDPQDKEPSS